MKASSTEHLAELRRRLISVIVFFVSASIICFPLSAPLLLAAKADLLGGMPLIILEPQEAVLSYYNVSLLLAFALSLPLAAYHMWSFVAPGLLVNERRLILWLVAPSFALFILGASFGYLVLIPIMLRILLAAAEPLATPMLTLSGFVSFVTFILAALGLVFQMPLIAAALSKMGILKAADMSRYRAHAVVAIFLSAGIFTPDPSPVNQTLLALPMLALYEAGIVAAKIFGGKDAG